VRRGARVVLLALAWLALTGSASPANVVFGVAVSWLAWRIVGDAPEGAFHLRQLPAAVRLAAFFVKELFVANLRVAWIVMAPRQRLRPGIVAVPLDVKSEAQITLLANLITLTPGTLSVDVSSDRKVLYVHLLELDDPAAARREIKQGFERRVCEVLP